MKKMHVPSVIAGPAVESARRSCDRSRGFTLIELLVVISIIALLIGILLPTLGKAREEANAIKCAASARSIGQAVANYTAGNKDYYPASYVYLSGKIESGACKSPTTWNFQDQNKDKTMTDGGHPLYYHWSYALVGGSAGAASFTCPSMLNGGLPRTNPGPKAANWDNGQTDDGPSQSTTPNPFEDKQVERVAFGVNGFVMPRNKFYEESGSRRVNVFVKSGMIRAGSKTILAAEYFNDSTRFREGSVVKSHRPFAPVPNSAAGCDYLTMSVSSKVPCEYQKALDGTSIDWTKNTADVNAGGPNLNGMARHHRGGKSATSAGGGNEGSGNTLFVDGHVARMTPRKTLEDKLWGDRIYSMNGDIVPVE